METLGLVMAGFGVLLLVWRIAQTGKKSHISENSEGIVVAGKVVYLNEWLHEGYRRCQVEYVYDVVASTTDDTRTLRGQSNVEPKIFDTLELNTSINVRYLPQHPEFSRPVFNK